MSAIPEAALTAVVKAYPDMRAQVADLRRCPDAQRAEAEREFAARVIWRAHNDIELRTLVALESLAKGKGYGAYLASGRDDRIRALAAQGLSTAQIAAAMPVEGWEPLSRSRIHQIISDRS